MRSGGTRGSFFVRASYRRKSIVFACVSACGFSGTSALRENKETRNFLRLRRGRKNERNFHDGAKSYADDVRLVFTIGAPSALLLSLSFFSGGVRHCGQLNWRYVLEKFATKKPILGLSTFAYTGRRSRDSSACACQLTGRNERWR